MNTCLRLLVVLAAALSAVTGGCVAKRPLPMESQMKEIKVGQTTSSQLLNLLGSQKIRHSTNSMSLVSETGWATELVVVQFNEEDSQVQRKLYLQMRSRSKMLYTTETLRLDIETTLTNAVLDEPYEDTMRKQIAILDAFHNNVIEDTRPFKDEQQVVSLMGLARSVIGVGIQKLKARPRQADDLVKPSGFSYDHPTLGGVTLHLNYVSEKVYRVAIQASDTVDGVNNW